MARALVQSTDILSSVAVAVAGERAGQFNGSRKNQRSVRMICDVKFPSLKLNRFVGLRGCNALDTLLVKSGETLHSKVAAATFVRRPRGCRFVPKILLGLIGEGTGIAAKVLKSMGINLKDARVEVEKIIGRGSVFIVVEIPFTPLAKRVLELSLEEARQLGHNYIHSEHLLLGLLREGEGVAARVLENLGADPSNIRTQATNFPFSNWFEMLFLKPRV
ncbi:hypothetical protein MTR67_047583 [Solanum verrucosum]|uniref:Clp R domain-containing protein n=1 Tax=Solanum verrucosum TaxID=315347 RepID=A0AAF0ZYC4_SOLVR|nr:hypothetical protein MTR67_047583 [Solanum verrucosum]